MRFSLSIRSVDQYLEEFRQQVGGGHHSYGYESVLELQPLLARGWMRQLKLRGGLELFVCDLECRKNLAFEGTFAPDHQVLGLSFCVSGQTRATMQDLRKELHFSPGKSCLGFAPGTRGTMEWAVGQRITWVGFSINPITFGALVGEQLEQVPANLQRIVEGTDQSPHIQVGGVT